MSSLGCTYEIDVDLGDLGLEYEDDISVIWLWARDRGRLREACEWVAALALMAARELAESAAMEMAPTTFDERVEHGPWFSVSRPPPPG